MTAFMPVTLRFCDNKTMLVSSVAEAATALGQQWPDKTAPGYLEAARLVALAVDGTCCQRIAFDALTRAASATEHLGGQAQKPRSRLAGRRGQSVRSPAGRKRDATARRRGALIISAISSLAQKGR